MSPTLPTRPGWLRWRWEFLWLGMLGWTFLLFATHSGADSPYSYGWSLWGKTVPFLDGVAVNPDAVSVAQAVRFFYEPWPMDFTEAHNLLLPVHGYMVALVLGVTRSYVVSCYLVNGGFLAAFYWVVIQRLRKSGLGWGPCALGLATLCHLPFLVHYIGQPMHYLAGFCLNSILALALLDRMERPGKAPLGTLWLCLCLLTFSYDWYVWVLGMAIFAVSRAAREDRARVALVALTALVPISLWKEFLQVHSHHTISTVVQSQFVDMILTRWLTILANPALLGVSIYTIGHVGATIAIRQILAYVYWPILGAGLWLAFQDWRLLRRQVATRLWLCLVGVYLFQQTFCAAFDWENNPRRFLPGLLAFGAIYLGQVNRHWAKRAWLRIFAGLLAVSVLLAYADTLLASPMVSYIQTMQATKATSKDPMEKLGLPMNPTLFPHLPVDRGLVWFAQGKARVQTPILPAFLVGQGVLLVLCLSGLSLVVRLGLLPRLALHGFQLLAAFSLLLRFW